MDLEFDLPNPDRRFRRCEPSWIILPGPSCCWIARVHQSVNIRYCVWYSSIFRSARLVKREVTEQTKLFTTADWRELTVFNCQHRVKSRLFPANFLVYFASAVDFPWNMVSEYQLESPSSRREMELSRISCLPF